MVDQTPKRQTWPVDPETFPLSGPTRGPVYTPPAMRSTLGGMFALYAVMGALWLIGGIMALLMACGFLMFCMRVGEFVGHLFA